MSVSCFLLFLCCVNVVVKNHEKINWEPDESAESASAKAAGTGTGTGGAMAAPCRAGLPAFSSAAHSYLLPTAATLA